MKKRIVSLAAIVVLIAIMLTSFTMAYFTDSEQNTNVYSVAGLDIILSEQVNHVDDAENPKAMLNGEDKEVTGPLTTTGIQYQHITPGDVMTKIVTVTNNEEYPAYVALAIQQGNWPNFNSKIDTVYEGAPYNYNAEQMQQVTDDIFSGSGWNGLSYDKKTNGYEIRYYPANVAPVDQDGSESYVGNTSTDPILIAVDYTVRQSLAAGNHYSVGYKDNMFGTKMKTGGYNLSYVHKEGETYSTLPLNHRLWVYYLYLPAGASYTLDLSITCPTYITTENIEAFENMEIDVRASAIQVDGFATAKDAFTELNKTYNFGF